jgi:Flp pilus assembly protein TadG
MQTASGDKKIGRKRGFAMVEFTLIGIPLIFLTLSIIEASLAMWQYHSMVYAVDATTRYVTTHGRGCTQHGNTCSITVGTVATLLVNSAGALDSTKLNVTLTTASNTTPCNPVSTCMTSSTQFPAAADNGVNSDVTIAATYPISNPITFFLPGSAPSATRTFTLGASSRQRINF